MQFLVTFDTQHFDVLFGLAEFRVLELREQKENIEVLCVKCHKELHNNPWRLIEQMKAKAQELGINLEERYGRI